MIVSNERRRWDRRRLSRLVSIDPELRNPNLDRGGQF